MLAYISGHIFTCLSSCPSTIQATPGTSPLLLAPRSWQGWWQGLARLPANCQQHGQLSTDGDNSRDQEWHDVIFRSVGKFSAATAGKKQHFPV